MDKDRVTMDDRTNCGVTASCEADLSNNNVEVNHDFSKNIDLICVICGDGSMYCGEDGGRWDDPPVIKEEVVDIGTADYCCHGADGSKWSNLESFHVNSLLGNKSSDGQTEGKGEGGGSRVSISPLSNDVNFKNKESGRRSLSIRKWTDTEKDVYQWFLKWFRLPLVRKENGIKKNVNYGWDGNSGEDPFPFCEDCSDQLFGLLELQKRMEELETKIKNEVERLKTKAISFEGTFGTMRFYERDQRIKRIRKLIVPDFKSRYPQESSLKGGDMTRSLTRRKSKRKSIAVSNYDPFSHHPLDTETLPVVVLSLADKINAEQHSLDMEIKAEKSVEDSDARFEEGDEVDRIGTEPRHLLSKRSTRESKSLFNDPSLDRTQEEFPEPIDFLNEESLWNDAEDNVEDYANVKDDDYDPSSTPRPSRRSKKVARQRLVAQEIEDDSNPNSPPPTSTKKRGRRKKKPDKKMKHDRDNLSSSPHPTGNRKHARKQHDDDDWGIDEEAQIDSPDEDDDTDKDSDYYDPETGKRKNVKLIIDLEKKTLTYKHLVFHQMKPITDNLFQCSECGHVLKHNHGIIRTHFYKFHSNRYACKQCDHRSDCKGRLNEHVRRVHEGGAARQGRLTNCRICGKPTTMSRVKIHEWSHKNQEEKQQSIASGAQCVPAYGKKRHQCEECGHQFGSSSQLRYHRDVKHTNQSDMKIRKMELCPECGGTFVDLKSHLKRHSEFKGRTYTCLESNCGKSFGRLSQLTKHKNAVHRKIRPYKCTMCPREFSHSESFQNHLNLHNGVRPLPCQYCPMSFTTKSTRQRHERLYHTPGVAPPKRKPFIRGPTMLGSDVKKVDLLKEGKYLPPSALATWAAGREPTSHFPVGMTHTEDPLCGQDDN